MKKEKMQQLGHLVAGIVTLIYGFDAFEAGDFTSSTGYLSLAVLFMLVAGLHKWVSKQFIQSDFALFFFEAITILFCGWHYNMKGNDVLFYEMIGTGTLYIVFALLSIRLHHKSGRGSRRRHHSPSPSTLSGLHAHKTHL